MLTNSEKFVRVVGRELRGWLGCVGRLLLRGAGDRAMLEGGREIVFRERMRSCARSSKRCCETGRPESVRGLREGGIMCCETRGGARLLAAALRGATCGVKQVSMPVLSRLVVGCEGAQGGVKLMVGGRCCYEVIASAGG